MAFLSCSAAASSQAFQADAKAYVRLKALTYIASSVVDGTLSVSSARSTNSIQAFRGARKVNAT
jgi:hypothetical protein